MTEVRAELEYTVTNPTTLVLQIGAARTVGRYRLESNGTPLQPQQIEPGVLLVTADVGRLSVHYEASLPRQPVGPLPVSPADRVVALRPSRYCPADRMNGFATDLVGHHDNERDWVLAVCGYAARYLRYTTGVSDASTDAVDTLLIGAGVCRDYAHVVAALCRAVGVPARVASVYAPGLDPMDFHLVVEAAIDGYWHVFDATRLAPASRWCASPPAGTPPTSRSARCCPGTPTWTGWRSSRWPTAPCPPTTTRAWSPSPDDDPAPHGLQPSGGSPGVARGRHGSALVVQEADEGGAPPGALGHRGSQAAPDDQ